MPRKDVKFVHKGANGNAKMRRLSASLNDLNDVGSAPTSPIRELDGKIDVCLFNYLM